MRLEEIVEVTNRDESPAYFAGKLVNPTDQIRMPNDMTLRIYKTLDEIHLGVYDQDIISSYVSLHKEGTYWQVDMQCSDYAYRNQGFIRYCLEYAIKQWGPVICDWQQTPLAKAVWTALIKKPNTIQYKQLNTKTGEIIPFTYDDWVISPNPWNDNSDIIIIAEGKIFDSFSIEMRKRRTELDRARGRRDPWLGEGFLECNP